MNQLWLTRSFLFCILCCTTLATAGTDAPFRIDVQPYQIDSMPSLHSGVFCESEGKWLLIGGRTNGLHGFQGLVLFPEYTQNTTIYVVDPVARKLWTATTDAVPAQIREHINSSNMQWVAASNGMLHIIGGYGYSTVRDSFITFPYRTSVRINELINAVTNKTSLNGLFKQEYDIRYAVCGAHASEAYSPNHIRLIFGHRFDGIYNREDNGSGFTQQYTNSVALIAVDSSSDRLSSWQSVSDTLNYHRRDYALGHSFSFRDKQRYVTAYSGVFTPKKNTAYTTCVDIRNDSIVHHPTVNQLYSHYHCATATFLDTLAKQNHTLFFGGMALNYPDSTSGIPVLDTAIPFVRTISCITRLNDGTFRENVVGTLPSLEGTNAYFFPAKSPYPDMPVLQQNSRQLIGYMYGGIISPKPNISQEDPAISTASSRIYTVWADSRISSVAHGRNEFTKQLIINAHQSSKSGDCEVRIFSPEHGTMTLSLVTTTGVSIFSRSVDIHEGVNTVFLRSSEFPATGTYFVSIAGGNARATAKLIHVR